MWPFLILAPLIAFVGVSLGKRGSQTVTDYGGQPVQVLSPVSATDGASNPSDFLLNTQPFQSPNGDFGTAFDYWAIREGDPAYTGFDQEFNGPPSTPGGSLRPDVLPVNYQTVPVRNAGGHPVPPSTRGGPVRPTTGTPVPPRPTTWVNPRAGAGPLGPTDKPVSAPKTAPAPVNIRTMNIPGVTSPL